MHIFCMIFLYKCSLFTTLSRDKVSMSHLSSFWRYQTKCVSKFLFRPLMTSWTLRFFLDQPVKQWLTGSKREEDKNFRVAVVKNGHGTLISKWMDESSWFMHANIYSRKLKSYFNGYCLGFAWYSQIWVLPFRSWYSIICCFSRMNEWIKLIFCMLLHSVRDTLGVHMVKYGCDLLGPWTLKSALSQE